MMSEVSGIAKLRFNDTLAETHRFLHQNEIKSPEQAWKKILEIDTGVRPVLGREIDISLYFLMHACWQKCLIN